MKIKVDVDCTPEEARRFMGLPDMGPVHDVYVDQMKRALSEGLTPDMIDSMMSSWGPWSEAGLGAWRQIIDRISGGAAKS